MSSRLIWNGLISGLISILVCVPARGDGDLSSFVGVWASINPPGPHMTFIQIGNSVEGSFPQVGSGVITQGGRGGSNFTVSGQGFTCSYFVILDDLQKPKEMTWEFKAGSSVCPQSAYFKFIGSRIEYPGTDQTPIPARRTAWLQNDSVMTMVNAGDKVDFYYELTTEYMQATGATTGTLKFTGEKRGIWYTGKAFVYTKYCIGKPFGYQVSGSENADRTVITLTGRPPRVDPRTCQAVDYSGRSGNYLEFHRLPSRDDRIAANRRRRT